MKKGVELLYLSFVNDFLSVERFAEYYDFTLKKARRIIDIGRKINHRKSKA